MSKEQTKEFAKYAGIPDDVPEEALLKFGDLLRTANDAEHAQMQLKRLYEKNSYHSREIGELKKRMNSMETYNGYLAAWINSQIDLPGGVNQWCYENRIAERNIADFHEGKEFTDEQTIFQAGYQAGKKSALKNE